MSKQATPVLTRFSSDEFSELDDWRRRQPKIPGLSDSVRELVRLGLRASQGKVDVQDHL